MSNLRLKALILEVVDNQLKENNPPETKQAYEKLLEAGYSKREAKEKIGAVALTEIYDIMKENQPYDEERYVAALKEMVQQSVDFEDCHEIVTEWDEWDTFVEEGYEAESEQDSDRMISCWWKAWDIFQKIVETFEEKMSVTGLMELQDYKYPVDAWLQDLEMELGNVGEHENRMRFCKKVLEMFDWTFDDSSNFKAAIGEEMYAAGDIKGGKEWFEKWTQKEPDNQNALIPYSWCLREHESLESAYQLLRRRVINVACTMDNDMVFENAKFLADELNQKEDSKWIESQLEKFYDSIEKAEEYNDFYDTFEAPVKQPIVKVEKIYPNDPCPCGSGKKYKKCCGK